MTEHAEEDFRLESQQSHKLIICIKICCIACTNPSSSALFGKFIRIIPYVYLKKNVNLAFFVFPS
jgi:hypothetical protein